MLAVEGELSHIANIVPGIAGGAKKLVSSQQPDRQLPIHSVSVRDT